MAQKWIGIDYTRTVLIYTELVPQTLAYLGHGQVQPAVEDYLGGQYEELTSSFSGYPVWKYEDHADSSTYTLDDRNSLIDFDGLITSSINSQLLVYWGKSDSNILLVDYFLLYFKDPTDGKIHEYYVTSKQILEDRIIYSPDGV